MRRPGTPVHRTTVRGARPANRAASRFIGGILALTAIASWVQAGEIYKSYDANGNVVYSDHLDFSKSSAGGQQLIDSGLPPPELHVCWTNCFRLILDNGTYRRTDGTDETWTVETFTPKAIVLHRHDPPADWNGYRRDVVYAGQVFHDRLIDVTVDGKPVSSIDASWGTALNTLPGSNSERDGSTIPAASTATPPPPPREEEQPELTQDGYLWTPGYWTWRTLRYIWIPGAWRRPPQVGFLWTPAYWALDGGMYIFHPGHWGRSVGFYGGVNYGHGYFGNGYTGGHWSGKAFAYDSTVNHLNPAFAHGVPPHRAAPPTFDKLATTVQRIREPTPTPIEAKLPTSGVKTPALGTPEKTKHIAPVRAAPVKP
jgi:hypothetical protein